MDFDLVTTTILPMIGNICQNQTTSSSDDIENRINVVVPYLVVLGKYPSNEIKRTDGVLMFLFNLIDYFNTTYVSAVSRYYW